MGIMWCYFFVAFLWILAAYGGRLAFGDKLGFYRHYGCWAWFMEIREMRCMKLWDVRDIIKAKWNIGKCIETSEDERAITQYLGYIRLKSKEIFLQVSF